MAQTKNDRVLLVQIINEKDQPLHLLESLIHLFWIGETTCLLEPNNHTGPFSSTGCIVRTQNHHNKKRSKSLIRSVKVMSRVSGFMVDTHEIYTQIPYTIF
jgi:hypothetical protein